MIEIDNLTKEINKNIVLNKISLKINKNEVLVILGKSGSGKSLLLKSIIGLIKPTRGHVSIEGNKIETLS